MNTFGSRLNTLFFFFLSIFVGLACLTNVTTMFRSPSPPVKVSISNPSLVRITPPSRYGFDPGSLAKIKFDLDADLRGVFDWSVRQVFVWITAEYGVDVSNNNNQKNGSAKKKSKPGEFTKNEVVIWDTLIDAEDKQDAHLQVKDLYTKYKLSDFASPIKNVPIALKLHWETSPWTGFFNVYHAGSGSRGHSESTEIFTL